MVEEQSKTLQAVTNFFNKATKIVKSIVSKNNGVQKYADSIIRNSAGEILLLQRSFNDDLQPGKWCLPGGKVEDGEDINIASYRELQEETGIEQSSITPLNFIKNVLKPNASINYFQATVKQEDLLLLLDNEEHYRYEFVPVEWLDRYDLIFDLGDVLNDLIELLEPIVIAQENLRALTPEELVPNNIVSAKLAFDNGQISEDDFLLYNQITNSFELIRKGFESGMVSPKEYSDAFDKAKHFEFVSVTRDGKQFYQYREVGTDKLEDDLPTGDHFETGELGLRVTKYSDKSFLISGATYENLELLRDIKKEMGIGNWNKALNGWIFPSSGKDIILSKLAEKMPDGTYEETKAKESVIDLKNALDVGTTVSFEGEQADIQEVSVDDAGKVTYEIESKEHGVGKKEVTEEEIEIPPASEEKAQELIANVTEENRMKIGKELFGKQEGEKPVSEEIEKNGEKDIKIYVKEITTRSGEKINALDYSFITPKDVQIFDQAGILDKPKPYWIPDVEQRSFEGRGYTLNFVKHNEDQIIIELNPKDFMTTYYRTGSRGHNTEADYAVVSLEQFVAIQDYYRKVKKAELEQKNLESLKTSAERIRGWDEKLMDYYKPFDYDTKLSKDQKKKYSKEQWESLSLDEKIAEVPFMKKPPFKGVSTRVSVLQDNRYPISYFSMYKKLVDPGDNGIKGRMVDPKSNSAIEYNDLRRDIGYKTNDLEVQKEENDNTYAKGQETSYGNSGLKDDLLESLGVKIKTQNGKEMKEDQVNDIKTHLSKVYESFGNRSSMAKEYGLKISHAGETHMHASRASGIYFPYYKAIGVGHTHDNFGFTLAHEFAHFIDNYSGTKTGRNYASDDYNSLAGKIATTFRGNVNKKTDSKYMNRTCECFARAFEQYHALKTEGDGAIRFGKDKYYDDPNQVNKEKFDSKIKPLIEQFLKENDHILKSSFDELNILDINNNFELIKSAFDNGSIEEDVFLDYAGKYNEIIKGSGGDPSHGGKLVKKTGVDAKGHKTTKWIRKDEEGKDEEVEKTKHSHKELSEFAKDTPASELKAVINSSGDPKLRRAAHLELDRRVKKESIKKEKSESGKNNK